MSWANTVSPELGSMPCALLIAITSILPSSPMMRMVRSVS